LAQEVAQQRAEIERLVKLVEMFVGDLDGSVEGMENAAVEGLSRRAREAEGTLNPGPVNQNND
jgi:hypothetical protein